MKIRRNNESPRRSKKILLKRKKEVKNNLDETKNYTRLLDQANNYKKIKLTKEAKPKKDNKIDIIFIFAVLLIILICSLIFLGKIITIVFFVGSFIIIGLTNLLSKLRKNKALRITLNILSGLMIFFIIAAIGGLIYFGVGIVKSAPDFNQKLLQKRESTIVYDKDGNVIAELGTEKRDNKVYEDYSETLIDSIIATEDARFFQHNGFDLIRFLKASAGQLRGQDAGGASTLSMQVIKNTYTDTEAEKKKGWERFVRKFQDIYLAIFELEKNYTKREIIQFYANNQQIGPNAFGVEQASKVFMNKSANKLNLAESSLIAGLFQAPSAYNPFKHPEKATARRETVLYLLERHGYINKKEREIASRIPVQSLLNKTDETYKYPGYIDAVIDELTKTKGYNPFNEALYVYTNLDSDRQQKIEDIMNGVGGWKWPNDKLDAGVAVVEVNTGKVLALGRGRNKSGKRDYSNATDLKRQIGSTAKPIFDYAPGMEFNGFSTYTAFKDEPYTYSNGRPIKNHDGGFMGWLTLRDSLSLSRNIPALKAFQKIDKNKLNEFVTGLGIIPEKAGLHEAHAIGAFDGVNNDPLHMAAAYAAFANGGTYYKPYLINKVVNRQTNEKKVYEPDGKRAMMDSTAFMIADVLKTTATAGLARGTNPNNGAIVGAKTGSTNYDNDFARAKGLPWDSMRDMWVVGFDPEVAMGVWYGYDNYKDGVLRNYDYQPNYRFVKTLSNVVYKSRGVDFKVPDSVVKVGVEFPTSPAQLASPGTPAGNIRYEWFRKGTEPTEVSVVYNKLPNVSGLKVTYDKTQRGVLMSWNAVPKPASAKDEYGKFGYKIYVNDHFKAFTEANSFKINDIDDYSGTYKVITCYEGFGANASSGSAVTIQPNYTLEWKPPIRDNNTYDAGHVTQPLNSDIIVKIDGDSITADVNIKIINNATNSEVSRIENPGTYTVKYKVTYKGREIGQKTRTITVNS